MKLLRNLNNYKHQHKDRARTKGCLEEFLAAPSLTVARKLIFGEKVKRAVQREEVYRRWRTDGAPGGVNNNPVIAFTSRKR